MVEFHRDNLAIASGVIGGYILLAGLYTFIGMPWNYVSSIAVSALQILGALGLVAVGIGLLWIGVIHEY
ncbi:MAG: hypothetical protein ABEI06_06995 [Halobacteriaceae archaeon]